MMPQWYQKMTPSQCHESWDNDYDYASASVKKWCLNGVIMMPQWCQISDASMVSQKWCLNGVIMMPRWCQISDASMVSQKWCLNGVKEVIPQWCHNMMPKWCQRSDALMVSQHWCRDGVMHSWCCDSVMQQWRLRYPPRWSFHPLGFTWVWPSKILVVGPCFLGLESSQVQR